MRARECMRKYFQIVSFSWIRTLGMNLYISPRSHTDCVCVCATIASHQKLGQILTVRAQAKRNTHKRAHTCIQANIGAECMRCAWVRVCICVSFVCYIANDAVDAALYWWVRLHVYTRTRSYVSLPRAAFLYEFNDFVNCMRRERESALCNSPT